MFPYVNGGLFSGSMDVPRFSPVVALLMIHPFCVKAARVDKTQP